MRLVLNKVPFPINIFLRLGKAGWYCVTKGNIFFCVLLSLFSSDLSLSVKLTSDRNFSENLFGYPLFFRRIAGFHSRYQQPCFSTKTKGSVCIIIELNSRRIWSGHQHGRLFFV